MSDLIVIDPNKIKIAAQEGGKFIFKPEAEKYLLELLDLKDFIDQEIEGVKEAIASAGREISPGFQGVKGAHVKAIFRAYGDKYSYDEDRVEDVLPFLKKVEYYKVDSDKVETYIEEKGAIPNGIVEKPRVKKLNLSKT